MPVSPAAREQVIQSLGEHFAQDRLSLDEYERRVQEAWRVPSTEALMSLTSDLALPVPAGQGPRPAVADDANVPSRSAAPKRFLALLSGVGRMGRWEVPARVRAVAVLGGIDLDLRQAILTAPVTEITVTAVLGGVSVKVPAGVRLESEGSAILGGFADQVIEPQSEDPNAPIVRVRGIAILGGVETRVEG